MAYRLLTGEEINLLLSQGCFAQNWSDLSVRDGFSAKNIRNTRFEGKVSLGVFSGKIKEEGGLSNECGIFSSFIRNCDIADNVYISEVKNLTNYSIAENVSIENVGLLEMNGESAFGNGIEVEALNEGGGRGIPIFDKLTAQIAYLAVLYRHDKDFTGKLLGIIRNYSDSKLSARGRIESFSSIHDTLIIRNVSVGAYTTISGACLLEEGTISSCREAPSFIGEGVMAKKFIILSGSRVDGSALLEKTFIGQGVKMGKQYSSENSLFFANSEAFHGEGCSIFAGPYTVTHHKSTLLIASLFSFFNAGSGTNQSNHMYKLGPVHQGILERGSKTGSFAYLLLPSRVGAFTVVMGKHYTNFDSSDFPFSYITEEKGKSEITPGMNIFTVGTRRDSEKWASRDRRKDPVKLDLIHFDLFSPYIVSRVVNGINILNELAEKTPKTQDYINYKGLNIHRLLLKTSRKYYEMALKIFIGQEVIKRLDRIDNSTSSGELREKIKTHGNAGRGKWIDFCGLITPISRIEALIDSVKAGNIKSLDNLNDSLLQMYNNYDKYTWEWCSYLIEMQLGTDLAKISAGSLIQIIADWKLNAVKFNNMILKDAEKEFDTSARLGFGIDGDENTRDQDFQVVRGSYTENKFVIDLKKETTAIEEKADRIIGILERIQ